MTATVPASANPASAGLQPVIGIVDDDPIMGESLVQRLQLEGYRAIWWQSGEEALSHLPGAGCRVLVCDIRLPDLDGEQLFRRALPGLGATPVVFITAFGEVEQAVRLMQAGADDYVTKPFAIEVLLHKIAALCAREIAAGSGTTGRETLSASAAMRGVETELLRVTDMASPVLLLGETGVGKEVAARQLHNASMRRDQPFVVVSCATIPVDRAESEMFGHERGGVVGSRIAHVGLVEQAGRGTLFLDEVAALPPLLQGKLLRLLEDGSYRRLGGTQEFVSEARIVSSSNADLPALVAGGIFRADLYYRLNVIELRIPPLRSRGEDIIPLAEHYLAQFARGAGHRVPSLTPSARAALREHGWPGNVRELRNRLERAAALASGAPQIGGQTIFPEQVLLDRPAERVASLAEARERAERRHIEEALSQTNGEIAKTAVLLGISRTTLWEKMRRLGL
ncbi:MAG TPA: sigma-54 dependent transcriptional regulator [Acetobacteraceae bacterium]|nr:sigma-54 dependent transcriptional regulator [Acetobacteraceae bacterium]